MVISFHRRAWLQAAAAAITAALGLHRADASPLAAAPPIVPPDPVPAKPVLPPTLDVWIDSTPYSGVGLFPPQQRGVDWAQDHSMPGYWLPVGEVMDSRGHCDVHEVSSEGPWRNYEAWQSWLKLEIASFVPIVLPRDLTPHRDPRYFRVRCASFEPCVFSGRVVEVATQIGCGRVTAQLTVRLPHGDPWPLQPRRPVSNGHYVAAVS